MFRAGKDRSFLVLGHPFSTGPAHRFFLESSHLSGKFLPGTSLASVLKEVMNHLRATPLVSVIIPTFDRVRFLERAIRSVLEQTMGDLECVVVDDGSGDGSWALLCRLADQDPRLHILRQENKGVSAARNAGVAHSTGPWLALLDSDDCWLPQKLEKHLEFMRLEGYAVSQTEETWLRGGRRVNPMRKHAKRGGRFFAAALELCLVSPSCAMFSRDFWQDVGPFDETLRACEDYDFWLRALLSHDIGLLPEALTIRHGGRPDQLSARITGLDLFRIKALCKLLRMPLPPLERGLVLDVLRRKERIYVQGCVKRGRLEEVYRVRELVRRAGCLGQDAQQCLSDGT